MKEKFTKLIIILIIVILTVAVMCIDYNILTSDLPTWAKWLLLSK